MNCCPRDRGWVVKDAQEDNPKQKLETVFLFQDKAEPQLELLDKVLIENVLIGCFWE